MANPLLSIILVVYREQAYLRDCVSSVLDQSFRDIELVAVDNSSPDQGPGILDETAPDVLVVDQTRAVPPGDAKPGAHGKLLEAAPDETFTLEEHPAAMELGVDVRDKVFRRAFLGALGLRAAAGGYGELTVTYPALLAAERISVLPR